MRYQVRDLENNLLDAHFEIDEDSVIFHSRGGSSGRGAQNKDYSLGLHAVLARLDRANLSLSGAWVDSSFVQNLPLRDRDIFPETQPDTPEQLASVLSRNMRSVGQTPGARGGNTTRRIRLAVAKATPSDLESALQGEPFVGDTRHLNRLPSEKLSQVRSDHIYRAVQRFRKTPEAFSKQDSTDYDLIDEDGTLLPPKVIFQIAASEALGFQVKPEHFVGGENTPCFRILRDADYPIVKKGDSKAVQHGTAGAPENPVPSPEEQKWVEGSQKRANHLKRERSRTASTAKRDAFRSEHGRLFCESCGLDPVDAYGGIEGEACIEVHHIVPITERAGEHEVRLEDLQLLCANCHRIVHRRLHNGETE